MSRNITLFAFCTVFAVLVLTGEVSARTYYSRLPREILKKDGSKTKYCYKASPCGWTIYVPLDKKILDYMPNTCKCPTGTTCELSDDDLSVSAFVHRCRASSKDTKDPNSSPQLFSS